MKPPARWVSGFCTPGHPEDSHARCLEHPRTDNPCACPCHFAVAAVALPSSDPLSAVVSAVAALKEALPRLVEACTDPAALDLAEFLLTVRETRTQLYGVEGELEETTRKAMLADQAESADLRVERYRSADRKEWDHDAWKRDARAKVLRKHGLLGNAGVVTADGEVADPQVLYAVLSDLQSLHSSAGPKTGKADGLRSLGMDPDDYCTTGKGVWHVKVMRLADETQQEGAA